MAVKDKTNAERQRRWRRKNRARFACRKWLANARKLGFLRMLPCAYRAYGGCAGQIELAHRDPDTCLVFRYLCHSHHRLVDAKRLPYPESAPGALWTLEV